MNKMTQDEAGLIPKQFRMAFILVTSLFFLWAIAHNLNDILIKQFQKAFDLSRGEASFIQTAFYLAYFFIALPAGIIIKKYGFKKAILIGLFLYAFGALLFYPAAEMRNYAFFLCALFIIASGIIFLESSGMGYVTIVGSPETSARRVNFSSALNGLGSVVAPIIGGVFIFSGVEYSPEQIAQMTPTVLDTYRLSEARQVQGPYLAVALILVFVASLIIFTKFPARSDSTHHKAKVSLKGLFKHRNFVFAVVAQFFYVGAQIGIWSYFIDFSQEKVTGLPEKNAAFYLSASLAFFMVGRFIGSYLMKYFSAKKMLSFYAITNVFLILLAIYLPGISGVVALALTSFFMSIMFPSIYAFGLERLGDQAEIASSFIIMTIIAGAIFPPIMGYIADAFSVQASYLIHLVSFSVVLVFSLKGCLKYEV